MLAATFLIGVALIVNTSKLRFMDEFGRDIFYAIDLLIIGVIVPSLTFTLHGELRRHALEFYGIRKGDKFMQ